MLHVHYALFGTPKDDQDFSAVLEEFLQLLFLLCSCFVVPNVCVCVCVRARVCRHVPVPR